MIKVLVVGLLVVGATLGGAFLTVRAAITHETDRASQPYFGGLDYVKTDIFGVPVLKDAKLQGYIVTQWVFTVSADTRSAMSVPLELIVTEEVFQRLYAEEGVDFDDLDRIDFSALSENLRSAINGRLGNEAIVQDVMVQKFDYVARGELRDGKPRSFLNATAE